LKRKGLELLGVVPHQRILSSPTMDLICEELDAEVLNGTAHIHNLVSDIVVGAMAVQHAMAFFRPGVLIITPATARTSFSPPAPPSAASRRRIGRHGVDGNIRPPRRC